MSISEHFKNALGLDAESLHQKALAKLNNSLLKFAKGPTGIQRLDCRFKEPRSFRYGDLEKLEGYRALVDKCKAANSRLIIYVNTRGQCPKSAAVEIEVDPARPYRDSRVSLEQRMGLMTLGYERADIGEPPEDRTKITVFAPLKLKMGLSA
ncbi:MAG: hypothetical protein EPN97_14160 [Alphaproteobacteria bacterium]|nr:MAG: hypothetical protein EPN97_14160 [Alphaproteobacteria bacterium]